MSDQAAKPELLADVACFGGRQKRYSHSSKSLDCEMTFSVFLPSAAEKSTALPCIYWLSGLTCTDENFVQKAGAQQFAEEFGVIVIAPDTSPRGEHVPDDPDGAWDFGHGAGFYLNATEPPWDHHYHMYDYVVTELPKLIEENFPVDTERCSIMGHSMGGHGALTIALKNPGKYRCASAFAPIVAPTQCPWGEKAFGAYLGKDQDSWKEWDAVELIKKSEYEIPVLVDQGEEDSFLEEQLKTQLLTQACVEQEFPLELHMRAGYDHSYFFIATFMRSHFAFHHRHLSSD